MMKPTNLLGAIVVLALLLAGATPARATPYTIQYDIGPRLLSNQTGNMDVQFNIADALSHGVVTSASYSFSFSDNVDTPAAAGGSGTDYQQVGAAYYRDLTKNYQDPPDTALIWGGGQWIGIASTPAYDRTDFLGQTLDMQVPYIYYVYEDGYWIPQVGYTNYYTNNYAHTFGWAGDVTCTGLLDASFVQSFTQNGLLSFSLQPFMGDMVFNNASLTVNVDESVPAVPEPASLLLLGTGLVGLVRWRKRR
jgi:hypothetical protein